MDDSTVRSPWEREVEAHIRAKYPGLIISSNDRSVIPSRDTKQNFEIDLFMPTIRLGIELNGEKYHDHSQYAQDKRNGTTYSKEAYKERYCESQGILLINIWSSQDKETALGAIDSCISQRLHDPSIEPYIGKHQAKIPTWLKAIFFIVAVPLWGFAGIALFSTLVRGLVDRNSCYELNLLVLPIMVAAFIAALVLAFGYHLQHKDESFSKAVTSLVIVFGIASGLCLYTDIAQRDPFTGYYSPEHYLSESPLSSVSVGGLQVENDLPYLEFDLTFGKREDIETAITELGYEGDPSALRAEAFNTTEDALKAYEPPRSLRNVANRLEGYTSFTGNGISYELLVTTYMSDYGKCHDAYIYKV